MPPNILHDYLNNQKQQIIKDAHEASISAASLKYSGDGHCSRRWKKNEKKIRTAVSAEIIKKSLWVCDIGLSVCGGQHHEISVFKPGHGCEAIGNAEGC